MQRLGLDSKVYASVGVLDETGSTNRQPRELLRKPGAASGNDVYQRASEVGPGAKELGISIRDSAVNLRELSYRYRIVTQLYKYGSFPTHSPTQAHTHMLTHTLLLNTLMIPITAVSTSCLCHGLKS